ncbi:hypothetical protein [Burkholderia multivorans]|uniref:hypothetical protein n=1 Tax=Burkholderia multivorans TaxID=87883 RepID=UPI0018DDA777|nr:hypothetical protein [Burkholderia multivorans]MBH9663658.1 hypothetical protein [Burkholderia multivorans]
MNEDLAHSLHRPDPPMPDTEPEPVPPPAPELPPDVPQPYHYPEGDPPEHRPPEREPPAPVPPAHAATPPARQERTR